MQVKLCMLVFADQICLIPLALVAQSLLTSSQQIKPHALLDQCQPACITSQVSRDAVNQVNDGQSTDFA